MNFNCLLKISPKGGALINYQSVRWRRPKKPFWLGLAKSKMFVIPETKKKRSPTEKAELRKIQCLYNTQVKSLLKFIKTDDPYLDFYNMEDSAGSLKQIELKEKINKSYEINEKWNAFSAELREKRLAELKQMKIENAIHEIQLTEENQKKEREKIEEIVRLEKERSKSYITMENLEEAIEKCLNSHVDYNFAIDLQGNKYPGKDPLPDYPSAQKKLQRFF